MSNIDTIEHAASAPTEDAHGSAMVTATASVVAAAALAACGGGDAPDGQGPATASATGATLQAQAFTLGGAISQLDAHRFLVQATFGPKPTDVAALRAKGFTTWLNEQFSKPASSMLKLTNTNYHDERKIGKINPFTGLDRRQANSAWWEIALTAEDQLRQRVAFALSEILVISMQVGTLAEWPLMCASYYDLLIEGAFGSYKDLVTKVSAHPAMGLYLSHQGNRKPDASHIPDQNFAREIMQLFTIGLTKLNMDGSEVLSATVPPRPVPTYAPYDVEVLSHVFTGWSFAGNFFGIAPPNTNLEPQQTSLMVPFDEFHSANGQFPRLVNNKIVRYDATANPPVDLTGDIKLLGSALNISATPNTVADRQAALDILFAHPNVAPFIAKQMIQRLVTSNPSKAYVGRAAKAFKDSGLNLKALVQAILLDTEARDTSTVRNDPAYGKLKEPILRVTQFLRAFKVTSLPKTVDGAANGLLPWFVSPTAGVTGVETDYVNYLGQSPLLAPTVFNFFRPGFVAPNTQMAKVGKVTPEMQICGESEVAAYARFMQYCTYQGMGNYLPYVVVGTPNPIANPGSSWSVLPDYGDEFKLLTDSTVTNLDARANAVIDSINTKLFCGAMSEGLKAHLRNTSPNMKSPEDQWVRGDRNSSAHRTIASLLFLCTISPEYVTQR